jgi:hypothetical protein
MPGRDATSELMQLLDEDVAGYSLSDWRARNLRLFDILVDLALVSSELVPRPALEHLLERTIDVRVGAASDPQNAGHVRAQNENVLLFGLLAEVPAHTLTVALVAGYIHDLNKAFREPLRTDAFAVRDGQGRVVPLMLTMAQIVGLNHLGDRTRRELVAATRLPAGALAPEVAAAIDLCIVHHGLGSSQFIRDLVVGKNDWWGHEFVDPKTQAPLLVHPPQPPLTLASVVHDLADSAQQMQGGVAWLLKYPTGYWRASGRSFADMLTGLPEDANASVPMSLKHQIRVEAGTCREIIAAGLAAEVVNQDAAAGLSQALEAAIAPSLAWVQDDPALLADPAGVTIYHDVARALGIPAEEARRRLSETAPGGTDTDVIEDAVWRSARLLDSLRARDLTHVIQSASRG